MFYDYRYFLARGKRTTRPPTPVVRADIVGRAPKTPPAPKVKRVENRKHYAAVPLNAKAYKKAVRDDAYMPRLVPMPGTKVALAPHGVREPHQIIKAAVVASQIGEDLLISDSRIPQIVEWRAATYFAVREVMPNVTRARAAKIMKRDRSTLIHFDRKRDADPDFLADKVNAIKEVLV